jgi:hypothetical protein
MGKLLNSLKAQLETDAIEDAIQCILVYEKLKELGEGRVWSFQWDPLVNVKYVGTLPNCEKSYSLSAIGEVFLKGLLAK